MGLDAVELIIAVEEKFGISIPDEEASEMRTVGDLYECVLRKIAVADRSTCLTQRTFHVLRRAAGELFGTPRRTFKLDTKLDLLVPRHHRRLNWLQFQGSVGATKWPELTLSWPGVAIVLALVLAFPWLLAIYVTVAWRMNFFISVLLALGMMVLLVRTSKVLTRPLQTRFGQGLTTVRDLTYVVLANNPNIVGADRAAWTQDEAWSLLSSVIKEQTGVGAFTKDSRIVEDLEID